MATFDRILAATDFSDASGPALAIARGLARDTGARLTIVHVCEVPGAFKSPGALPYDLVSPLVEAAQASLDAVLARARAECPDANGLVKVGAAWEEIVAAAAEVRADLVVLGTHGRRGVAHALLGSVAERVVRVSPVPVLTVRSAQAR
jgi:nucleotide-binding universal stress UspA family protein